MKKILILCMALALLFAGCAKEEPAPVTPVDPAPQAPNLQEDPLPPPPPEEPVYPQGPLSNLPEGTTVALAERLPEPQPAPITSWQVGDDLVELWEGTLSVGDRVLLQGAYDELDPLNIRFYEVEAVLDDHRFFYSCTGYDHMWGFGIYDLRTGTDTPLVVDSPYADSLIVEKVVGDTALMLYTTGPEFGFFLLGLNEAFPMTPLPVGYATEAEGLMGTSLISDDLTVMAFLEDHSEDYRFKVVEVTTGRVLLDWTTPQGEVIDSPRIFLEEVLKVAVPMGDDLWIYTVPYAASQGPLTDLPQGATVTKLTEMEAGAQPATAWQVGDTLVEYREGSLWAGDRELLAGRDWDETQSIYRMAAVLDDHRFLFCHTEYGWGHTATMGVYDLRDGTVTLPDHLSGLLFGREHEGKLLVHRQSITGQANWDYQLLDLQTLELEPLAGGYRTQAATHNKFLLEQVNQTLTRIAMVETTSQGSAVSVEDLRSGKLLFRMELPGGNFQPALEGENTLLLHSWGYAECLWRYTIPYTDDGSSIIDPPLGANIGLEGAVSQISLGQNNMTLNHVLPMTDNVFLALGGDGQDTWLVSCDAQTGDILHKAPVEIFDGSCELIHNGGGARFYNGQEYWNITLDDQYHLTMEQTGDHGRLLKLGDHDLDWNQAGALLIDGQPVLGGRPVTLLGVVDDHRLIYRQVDGSTGSLSDGLYDHRTGESRLLTFMSQQVWGIFGQRVLIAQKNGGESYTLSAFDLETMESLEAAIPYEQTRDSAITADRAGRRLAIRRGQEVTVYDLETGESRYTWATPNERGWQVCPVGDRVLMVWNTIAGRNGLWKVEY